MYIPKQLWHTSTNWFSCLISLSNSQFDRNNYEMLIRIFFSFLNWRLNININCCYNRKLVEWHVFLICDFQTFWRHESFLFQGLSHRPSYKWKWNLSKIFNEDHIQYLHWVMIFSERDVLILLGTNSQFLVIFLTKIYTIHFAQIKICI